VRRTFDLLAAVGAGVALAFLLLPLASLFLRISPATLVGQLGSDAALDALLVSVKTSVIAHAAVVAVGTPAAYLLGTRTFRGRSVVVAALELPLVLPPAVAGIALLTVFGRRGLLGGSLDAVGVTLPFTQVAVVIAVVFVAMPFYMRFAVAAFAAVDPALLDAARTLGAGSGKRFLRVALPLAAGGLGAGSALAWARGLGEFGATIMFAGSFQGVTQTLPLAIYAQLDQDRDVAVAIGALLVLVSLSVLVAVKTLPSWTRFGSTSLTPSAPSTSS
jgi:molybdate transport system permease protein